MSLGALTEALSIHILSYLERRDIAAYAQLRKNFQSDANKNQVWGEVIKQTFGGGLPETTDYKSFLKGLAIHYVQSNEDLVRRIQSFVDRISLGQNGRFRCSMGPHTNRVISVEIKGTLDPIPIPPCCTDDFDFTEYVVAVNGIGDGSCKTAHLPQYSKSSQYIVKLDPHFEHTIVSRNRDNDCIQAVLRIPKLSETHNYNHQTELEHKIMHIMQRKCEQLSDHLDDENRAELMSALEVCAFFFGLTEMIIRSRN